MFLKVYIKTEETIIKFDDINNPKQRFLQHKNPILIKILEINKIVVFNNVSFWKNGFKCLLATKIIKKLYLYVYFSQERMHIEKTLSLYLFK